MMCLIIYLSIFLIIVSRMLTGLPMMDRPDEGGLARRTVGEVEGEFSYRDDVDVADVRNLFIMLPKNGSDIFLFIFDRRSQRQRGTMFLFPKAGFVQPTPAKVRDEAAAAPFGFISPVYPLSSLLFNPYNGRYLTTRHLIAFEVTPESSLHDWYFARSPTTATQTQPLGHITNPPRRSPKDKPTTSGHTDLIIRYCALELDFFQDTRRQRDGIYLPNYEAVWPLAMNFLEGMWIWSNRTLVNVTIGVGFMGFSLTSISYPPLEIIVTPHYTNARMITRFKSSLVLDPPGPSEGPLYKVYVLGYGNNRINGSFYKTMRTIASYPEQSLDYRYHLSMAHMETALFLSHATPQDMDGTTAYISKISTRLATALFSLSEVRRLSGYVAIDELIDLDFNTRLLANTLLADGMQNFQDPINITYYYNSDVGRTHLRDALDTIDHQHVSHGSLITRARYLQLIYTYTSMEKQSQLSLKLSGDIVKDLYLETLYSDVVRWNTTAKQALFLSSMLIYIAGNIQSSVEQEAINAGRMLFLQCTSMCTTEHASTVRWNPQQILYDLTKSSTRFNIFDGFSPCMASNRYDIISTYGILDLFSAFPISSYRSIEKPAVDSNTHNIIFNLRNLYTFIPELFSCPGVSSNHQRPIAVLPIGINCTYLITRRDPRRGTLYIVDGIDVSNPIIISYLRSGECGIERGIILPGNLNNPENTDQCLYCGCVFMRYKSSGEIVDLLLINDKAVELELVAGENSTISAFNPTKYSSPSSVLLLFPNGTIVTLMAFTSHEVIVFSSNFIWASIGGVFAACLIIYIIIKMLCSFTPDVRYTLLNN
ncbi:envelope glycoprotein H [Felid alphaherpesvirus 1]|uniref:Envelope glycoprotein H n=1 Tax=Feline herpesvirus 1 TaxID=10334 RepID=D1FXW0_FHV1|nr:envelope glycoprotein H [Felid alphaherpesvirus 1]AMN88970.1 envelope glycoprotein H [synthetic construct]ACT88336.1 envelope glycoprotein H [Felid alphaherpesvirus 1]ALJ84068.1 envelope glycoprotein H [Felid alphaherpesvirus 1]ALJ84144.1 envelope glycoprotein H [Felid alphaherpesvirus 1]ALJ84220.1 envelope glycoprotein H [Felid alphaherpesvirus 1]